MAGELTAKDLAGPKPTVCRLCGSIMSSDVWRVRIEQYILDGNRERGDLVARPATILICRRCATIGTGYTITEMQKRARLTEGPGL